MPGSMPSTLDMPPIFCICAQLVGQILQVELALGELLRHGLGFLLVDVLGGLLDEAHHVAHAEDAARDALGVEILKRRRAFRRCRAA